MTIIREKCVETLDEIERAYIHKADRIELCGSLETGGLTPSRSQIDEALKRGLNTVVMIRSRSDFLVSPAELARLQAEMEALGDTALAGFVFGFLNPEGDLDGPGLKALLSLRNGKEAVFHMAFDEIPPDRQFSALDRLADLGFTRILTKGGTGPALKNVDHLKALRRYAQGTIALVAGGKVTDENYMELHERTGITQFHGRKLAGN
jgi:copper homeostasis protein